MKQVDAVMVNGKPHCPKCRVQAQGIVDYGIERGTVFWFVVVCPKCESRVRYTRDMKSRGG